jgi:hypothetical protein
VRLAVDAAPANRVALLVKGELRLASELDAPGLGPLASFAGPGANEITLELGQNAEHGEHQARAWWWCRPMRRQGSGDRLSCR